MKEEFLHFIWRTLSFNFNWLTTVQGEPIHLISVGRWNHDAGPDFQHARIRIGNIDWFGAVEIHIESGDWYKHGHEKDPGYNHVILHVVAKSTGKKIIRQDGTEIPEISLENRIPESLSQRYFSMMLSENEVPCGKEIHQTEKRMQENWLDRLGLERMEEKAKKMGERLGKTEHNWEQLLWEELACAIGGKVNGEAFRALAQTVPLQLIRKYVRQNNAAEALLYGSAGMLAGIVSPDSYCQNLQKEWAFLRIKHAVSPSHFPFKLSRMRPYSFPWIRISQLISIVSKFPVLMNLLSSDELLHFRKMKIKASSYWDQHYRFGETSSHTPKYLGDDLQNCILINTLIPIMFLFGSAYGKGEMQEAAAFTLENLEAEENKVTRLYLQFGIRPANALQSQGLIALNQRYCGPRNCLTCAIGFQLLHPKSETWKSTPSSLSEPDLKDELPWIYSTTTG